MTQATITFQNRRDADIFAIKWTRFTKTGHIISGNSVTVYDVDAKKKDWIDGYVELCNMTDDEILEALGA